LFGSASVALNYFAHRRSNNMFGVSSPAQRRYVYYSADIIANQVLPPTPRIILQQVILNCIPRLEMGATESVSGDVGELVLEIHNKTQREKKTLHRAHVPLVHGPEAAKDAIIFTVNCAVQVLRRKLLRGKLLMFGNQRAMFKLICMFRESDCWAARRCKRFVLSSFTRPCAGIRPWFSQRANATRLRLTRDFLQTLSSASVWTRFFFVCCRCLFVCLFFFFLLFFL
jgi:hypothetical protein